LVRGARKKQLPKISTRDVQTISIAEVKQVGQKFACPKKMEFVWQIDAKAKNEHAKQKGLSQKKVQ
jgi:hypothetical protein